MNKSIGVHICLLGFFGILIVLITSEHASVYPQFKYSQVHADTIESRYPAESASDLEGECEPNPDGSRECWEG